MKKTHKPWADSDVQHLKEWYPRKMPVYMLAARLGYTEQAIRQKVHQLGLKRPQWWHDAPETHPIKVTP
jgi:hypothetical protein